LAVASEHSIETALHKIVRGLAEQPSLDLALISLLQPSDSNELPFLRLVAGAGKPPEMRRQSGAPICGETHSTLIPWNVGKTGRIAATGETLFLPDARKDPEWAGDPRWAETNIPSFAGQPLIFRGKTLGVLTMWCRAPISERALGWLRLFADLAAVAVTNARAFEEIDRLQKQLQMENSYPREKAKAELAFGDIIGQSPTINRSSTRSRQWHRPTPAS
jgi:transcriptional regulator with GAF, ATPase, and Fis domain